MRKTAFKHQACSVRVDRCHRLGTVPPHTTLHPAVKASHNTFACVVTCGRVWLQQLEEQGKLADAAVAYIACKAHDAALRCYTHAGEWQMAFALLLQRAPDAAAIRRVAEDLIEQLRFTGRPAEAATVAETYLRDGGQALQLYIEAGEWRRALGVVGQLQRGGTLEGELAPAAAAAAAAQLADVRADAARAQKYSARLQALRAKRTHMAETLGALRVADGFRVSQLAC